MLQLCLQQDPIFRRLPWPSLHGLDVLVRKPGDLADLLATVDWDKVASLLPGMYRLWQPWVREPLRNGLISFACRLRAILRNAYLFADRYLHAGLLAHGTHGMQGGLQLLIRVMKHGLQVMNVLRLEVPLLPQLINLNLGTCQI